MVSFDGSDVFLRFYHYGVCVEKLIGGGAATDEAALFWSNSE